MTTMAIDNKDKKVLNVPHLRFPEFSGEWKKYSFNDIAQYKKGPFGSALKKEIFVPKSADSVKIYEQQNAIKKDWELGRYYISRDYFINHMQQFIVEAGDIIVSCAGTIGEIYELPPNAVSGVFNQALMRVRINATLIDKNIFIKVFSSMIDSFSKIYSNGSAIKNIPPFADLKKTNVFLPTQNEQYKISRLISLLDERIATQNKIIEDLKKLKSAIRKRVFSLLKDEYTESFEINQLLAYEQPSTYLVANDEYSKDITLIPVLTANKGFILGYTDEDFGVYQKGECIIFDDFTMDAKYVSFPFKVKSSAIKILTAKPCVNLRFMFEYLSYLELKSEEHKRHYISEIASLVIEIPSLKRQNEIAFLMTSLDNKLTLEENAKVRYENEKQYLLSQMFI
jgi:type I restriction enzyme S subunit